MAKKSKKRSAERAARRGREARGLAYVEFDMAAVDPVVAASFGFGPPPEGWRVITARDGLDDEEHRAAWDEMAGQVGAGMTCWTDGETLRFFGPTGHRGVAG